MVNGENEVREPEVSVNALFANCDAWGVSEWFERLVMAIQAQDRAVIAKDDVRFSIYRNIASTSAMRLARDYAEEIRTALARRSDGLGTVSVNALVWEEGDGINRSRECWQANSIVGRYTVIDRSWHGPEPTNDYHEVESNEIAFAQAQSDFETRVKSCLTSIGVEAGK